MSHLHFIDSPLADVQLNVYLTTAYYADLWPRKTFSGLLWVLPTSPNDHIFSKTGLDRALSQTKSGVESFAGKGGQVKKCKAPFGPFRFLVPDPVSLANPKTWS